MRQPSLVRRPNSSVRPGEGLLKAEHFQIAYVTNDAQRACQVFKDRYGVKAFGPLDANTPDGGQIHIELAWVGGVMFEIIEASGPGTDFYNDRLPTDDFAVRHHHFGYLTHDEPGWDALQDEIRRGGRSVAMSGHIEGFMRFCYVEAPELGHYLEYFLLDPAGVAFFENVPAS
jgi:hypothetical protein